MWATPNQKMGRKNGGRISQRVISGRLGDLDLERDTELLRGVIIGLTSTSNDYLNAVFDDVVSIRNKRCS